jgi:hypothetical protein
VNDFSPPPPPIPACHGLDTGRRVERHACPGRPALRGFTCVRDCESPRASIPHALTGKAAAVQCPPRPRAVASGFWLPPIGPIKDSHLLSFIHVQRTAGEALQALGGLRGRRERARVPSTAGEPSQARSSRRWMSEGVMRTKSPERCWAIRPMVRMVMEGVTPRLPPGASGCSCGTDKSPAHKTTEPKAPRGSERVTRTIGPDAVGRFDPPPVSPPSLPRSVRGRSPPASAAARRGRG